MANCQYIYHEVNKRADVAIIGCAQHEDFIFFEEPSFVDLFNFLNFDYSSLFSHRFFFFFFLEILTDTFRVKIKKPFKKSFMGKEKKN